MNTVLGLSVTHSRVGWVLVDAAHLDGPSLDDDAFDVGNGDVAGRAAAAARGAQTIAAASGHDIRSIGVTWCGDAESEANQLLALLKDAGCADVRAVPPACTDEPECDELDPVEQAYRAADAVATDTVPKARQAPGVQAKCRSRRSAALKFAAATVGVIAALGIGAQLISRDTHPVPEPSALPPGGEPQIVSAHVPLVPSHPATAVRSPAKRTAAPVPVYARPVQTWVPQTSVAVQAAVPSVRAEPPGPAPEPAPIGVAHLPDSDVPGPIAPGPAVPVAQTASADPAAVPPPVVVQPAPLQPDLPADPLAALVSALP